MKFVVREMDAADRAAWTEMRAALWPMETLQAHAEAIAELLADKEAWGFLAQTPEGDAAGFAEIAVREICQWLRHPTRRVSRRHLGKSPIQTAGCRGPADPSRGEVSCGARIS